MGWAHDGAVTSSIANTATVTRVGGLGGEELESATACCVVAVPGPGSEVPEPGATTVVPGPLVEVPEPPAEVPAPAAGVFKSDPTASGGAGMKMEFDSASGLTDGLRRRCRATPAGIACRVSRSAPRHLLARCHFLAHEGTRTPRSIH